MEDHQVPAEAPPSDAAPPSGAGGDRAPWQGRPAEPSEAPPPFGTPQPATHAERAPASVRQPYQPPQGFDLPSPRGSWPPAEAAPAVPPGRGYLPEPGAAYEPPPPPPDNGPLWPAAPSLSGAGAARSPWGPPDAGDLPPVAAPPLVPPALVPPPDTAAPVAAAAVGRASAPTTAPPSTGVPHARGAASTYRAGEFSREERLGPDPVEEPPATEPSRPPAQVPGGGELPRRREGAALAAEAPGFLAADRSAEPVPDLPTRRPRTAAESPWAAFAQPWLDSPAKPAGQPEDPAPAPPAAPAAAVPSAAPAPPVRPARS